MENISNLIHDFLQTQIEYLRGLGEYGMAERADNLMEKFNHLREICPAIITNCGILVSSNMTESLSADERLVVGYNEYESFRIHGWTAVRLKNLGV
jgi:hypothetical protein